MLHPSVRARLFAVVAVMAAIASLSIGVGHLVTETQRRDVQRQERAVGDLSALTTKLSNAAREQESAVDDYLLSGSSEALDRYERTATDEARFEEQIRLAADGVVDVSAIVDAFQSGMASWRNEFAEPAIRARATDPGPDVNALARAAARELSRSRAAITEMIGRLEQADAGIEQQDAATVATREWWGAAGVVLMLLVAGISVGLIRRWVTSPIDSLLETARRVESGERVSFHRRRDDEIGRLGDALERMRAALQDDAELSLVLNRFTEATTFAADDTAVARSALEALQLLVRPDAAVTHVLNRSKDRAMPEATLGSAIADVLPLHALSHCPGVVRGSVYVTSDLAAPLSVRCAAYPRDAGTLACVPLAHGELVGAVHLAWDATNAFGLASRGSVARIAEHAALAIGNRRLLAALQGMASTDPRTGLANTRTFDQAVEEALLSRKDEESVAVLMMDIDHFKDFNDRYGHPAGDEALRAFAEILRSAVREGDVAARYGGEEFAVLLASVDEETARDIAERIRHRTESTLISLAPGVTDRISVSIGLAIAPDHGTGRLSLLRVADDALYRAKEAGRNRVELAGTSELSA